MGCSFEPLDFLELARKLVVGELQDTEAILRTAVGRAYYALFLVARERTCTRERKKVHYRVIKAVKRRDRSTGEQLKSLFRLRKVADYELVPENPRDRDWDQNWKRAKDIVDHLLPKLQKL